jgi:hypothetical protein
MIPICVRIGGASLVASSDTPHAYPSPLRETIRSFPARDGGAGLARRLVDVVRDLLRRRALFLDCRGDHRRDLERLHLQDGRRLAPPRANRDAATQPVQDGAEPRRRRCGFRLGGPSPDDQR